MRYFVMVYDIGFGIRFWIPCHPRGVTVTFLDPHRLGINGSRWYVEQ